MSVSVYDDARTGVYASETRISVRRRFHAGSTDTDSDNSEPEEIELPTPHVDLADITERRKFYGRPTITLTESHIREREGRSKYDNWALVLRRVIDKHENNLGTVLEVRSPVLRRILKTILASYTYTNLDAVPILFPEPYHGIFHYRNELRKHASHPDRTDEERAHMAVLITFIKRQLGPIEELWAQMVPKQRIMFDLLWILYRPEDDLVIQHAHSKEIVRIINCEYKTTPHGARTFEIEAWRWGYNDSRFGPTLTRRIIPEFPATRHITHMPCYPIKQLPKHEQVKLYADLIAQGRKWKELVGPVHRYYDGPVYTQSDDSIARYEKARIILDQNYHAHSYPAHADRLIGANGSVEKVRRGSNDSDILPSFRRRGSSESDDSSGVKKSLRLARNRQMLGNMRCHNDDAEYTMTDEEAALCPSKVKGFSLASKEFMYFLIGKVKPVVFSENAFRQLELNLAHKETIRALVEMHGASNFDDFVTYKGRGIIMSLEGPPGAGKTLTAESIAELTKKPLYVISINELGSSAEVAEPALKQIFARAKAWDAILLLDEADLFLSKRTTDDMERNAFVTVFLRLLEYYEGILFLTTNRVEEYDPAFSSRIHLKVPFVAPTAEVRAAIWRNFLLPRDDCKTWDPNTWDRLGKLEINGREIKNLIQPALAISKYKQVPFSEDIIKQVYKINYER